MKISVITVSYNAEARIERTILSVINQTYSDFEYIIIDGGSSDGTKSIIEKYNSHIDFWVSEPDNGIYHAMNKGVQHAKGDFCIFMNAGDMFFNSTVLARISGHLDLSYSIITGNQVYLHPNGKFAKYGKAWIEVTKKRLFSDSLFHQASFIKKSDLVTTPYDESLTMVSDWKLALELLIVQKKLYKRADIIVDFFFEDGVTNTHREQGKKERQAVLEEFYSKKEQLEFKHALESYKRPTNLIRYWNKFSDLCLQCYKAATINTPSLPL